MDLLAELIPLMVAFGMLIIACRGEAWLARWRLKRDGRWLEWAEVVEKARAGEGYLIVNYGNIPGRVWWAEKLTDEYVAYTLSTTAFLTNCPFRLRGMKQLQREFPNVNVIGTWEYVIGDSA